jgi:hypothetical protein
MSFSREEARARAQEVRTTSATILRGLLPVQKIDDWNAAFQPLLAKAIREEADNPNRGPGRYYVTLPFHGLWADAEFIDNDAILAVVEELVGEDGVMCQLASDTPVRGSAHQDLHRDTQLLFPETGVESPPYQLAVNFPWSTSTTRTAPWNGLPALTCCQSPRGSSGSLRVRSRSSAPI